MKLNESSVHAYPTFTSIVQFLAAFVKSSRHILFRTFILSPFSVLCFSAEAERHLKPLFYLWHALFLSIIDKAYRKKNQDNAGTEETVHQIPNSNFWYILWELHVLLLKLYSCIDSHQYSWVSILHVYMVILLSPTAAFPSFPTKVLTNRDIPV